MRRRLPLLRTVLLLTTGLVVTSVLVLGFIEVPRLVLAPGRLVSEVQFEGTVGAADRSLLQAKQSVAIRLDAYPWMERGIVVGEVLEVEETPIPGGGFVVRIAVISGTPPGPLTEGLRGEARIETGETDPLGRLLFSRWARPGS